MGSKCRKGPTEGLATTFPTHLFYDRSDAANGVFYNVDIVEQQCLIQSRTQGGKPGDCPPNFQKHFESANIFFSCQVQTTNYNRFVLHENFSWLEPWFDLFRK